MRKRAFFYNLCKLQREFYMINKFIKKAVLGSAVLGSVAFSGSLNAEVSLSGSAEMDFFYRTNQALKEDGSTKGAFVEEIAITLNLDGKHEVGGLYGDVTWRLAQKVATDWRYDGFGNREAWIGYDNKKFGTLRFGNQFSNLYLMLDWPYGAQGAGNMWADYGAHEVQYGRGVSYFSPTWNGLRFAMQYDLGGYSNQAVVWDDASTPDDTSDDTVVSGGDANGNAYSNGLKSYAGEFNVEYVNELIKLDAAYYLGKNSGTLDTVADVFGSENKYAMGGQHATKQNQAQVAFVGAFVYLGDLTLNAGYKYNRWDGEVDSLGLSSQGDHAIINQFLVRAGYKMGQHDINLGYQMIADSKASISGVSSTQNDAVDIINFQYNYLHTDKLSSFIQIRHHMLRGETSPYMEGWQIDGLNFAEDNVTRILVGTYLSF